jgi:hypothetical protein
MSLSLFNIEGEHPRSVKAILRRFGLWSLICWISGGPSFAFAMMGSGSNRGMGGSFDPWAMALGIVLFSIGYTIFTSTDGFDRFQRMNGVRATLYVGYFTRLAASIAFPLGMAIDFIPGCISVGIAGNLLRDNPFALTLLATCIQGAILNVVLSVYMVIIYVFIRAFTKRREAPRGFEVIMPTAQAIEPAQIATSDNEAPGKGL